MVTHCGGQTDNYGGGGEDKQVAKGGKGGQTGRSQAGGIVKTVILPNEELNRLGVELEELKHFLN